MNPWSYSFNNPLSIYFVTFPIVIYFDIFIRKTYRDIFVDIVVRLITGMIDIVFL